MEHVWRQESPIGWLTVHSNELGVHRIEVGDHPLDVSPGRRRELRLLQRRSAKPPPLAGPEIRDEQVATEFDEYFAGSRRRFTSAVDLSDYEPHRGVDVLATLQREVGWGETVSYGELADMAGWPRAARFVGNVMARNPIPILIPCHRVIAAGGRIGGWGPSGTETKRYLLALEGVTVR